MYLLYFQSFLLRIVERNIFFSSIFQSHNFKLFPKLDNHLPAAIYTHKFYIDVAKYTQCTHIYSVNNMNTYINIYINIQIIYIHDWRNGFCSNSFQGIIFLLLSLRIMTIDRLFTNIIPLYTITP